jgi:hypothetical protein
MQKCRLNFSQRGSGAQAGRMRPRPTLAAVSSIERTCLDDDAVVGGGQDGRLWMGQAFRSVSRPLTTTCRPTICGTNATATAVNNKGRSNDVAVDSFSASMSTIVASLSWFSLGNSGQRSCGIRPIKTPVTVVEGPKFDWSGRKRIRRFVGTEIEESASFAVTSA